MCQFVFKCNVLNCVFVLIELETVAILPVAVQWVQRESHQLYRVRFGTEYDVCNAIKWSKAVRMSICQIEKSKRITRYPVEVLKLGMNRYYWTEPTDFVSTRREKTMTTPKMPLFSFCSLKSCCYCWECRLLIARCTVWVRVCAKINAMHRLPCNIYVFPIITEEH